MRAKALPMQEREPPPKGNQGQRASEPGSVSYTHLKLPTIYSV